MPLFSSYSTQNEINSTNLPTWNQFSTRTWFFYIVQFIFIDLAPNHNNSYVKALYVVMFSCCHVCRCPPGVSFGSCFLCNCCFTPVIRVLFVGFFVVCFFVWICFYPHLYICPYIFTNSYDRRWDNPGKVVPKQPSMPKCLQDKGGVFVKWRGANHSSPRDSQISHRQAKRAVHHIWLKRRKI